MEPVLINQAIAKNVYKQEHTIRKGQKEMYMLQLLFRLYEQEKEKTCIGILINAIK